MKKTDSPQSRTLNGGVTWSIGAPSPDSSRTVTVMAQSHPMIFADAVGVLTLSDFDILNARSYRNDLNILTTFSVRPLPGPVPESIRFQTARESLKNVLNGGADLMSAFKEKAASLSSSAIRAAMRTPPVVEIDNDCSYLFTLIQVHGIDFPGFLFAISHAVIRCGLEIWNTQITTEKDHVCDRFYVKGKDGLKITSVDEIAAIRRRLTGAFSLLHR